MGRIAPTLHGRPLQVHSEPSGALLRRKTQAAQKSGGVNPRVGPGTAYVTCALT